MTTLISQQSDTYFTLTTEKGKEIGVSVNENHASVYIKRNGLNGLSMGRHFHGREPLLQVIEAYKAADIKAAIRALISELA
jgi:hypothetical protein